MPQRAIGNFIRARRQELGLTQEELAERISVDGEWLNQSDISRIETGKVRLPRPERLERIAVALDVSLGDLLARVVAVGDDGQLLLGTAAAEPVLNNGIGSPGAGEEGGLPRRVSDMQFVWTSIEVRPRTRQVAGHMLELLVMQRQALLAVMSEDERRHCVHLLDDLDGVIQSWSALLDAPEKDELPADDETVWSADGADVLMSELRGDDFFRLLVDNVHQAVIVTDPDGTIKYWNRFAETLYGWAAGEVLGRSIVDVTPSEVSREEAEAIMERLRSGASWSGEFKVRQRDGARFLAHVIDTPVRDARGNLVAIIGVSHAVVRRPVSLERGNDRDPSSELATSTR